MSSYSSLFQVLSPSRVQTKFEEKTLPARYTDIMVFCLVQGGAIKNSFPIDTSSHKTVGHLKKAIKDAKQNAFSGIDADKLTLWRVDIVQTKENQEMTIKEHKGVELHSFESVGTHFQDIPLSTNIRIIVELPATTEPQRKSVMYEHIEEELVQIINGARQGHHMIEVDIRDVEEYQKQKFGRFYYKALPHGTKANKINLAMFGQMLEKAPMTDKDETLLDLVKSDIGENSQHKVVAMVGRSGAGKTATVVDLAMKHFVVYCVCSDPNSMANADFADLNFALLATDAEKMVNNIHKPETLQAVKDNDSLLKRLAGDRVKLEFLARLLLLQLLFTIKPELTPEQFFREQMNGGATTIGEFVGKLRRYDTTTIDNMLLCLQKDLTNRIYSQNQGLVIALDEAHIAGNRILAGKLISPSALSTNEEICNHKSDIKEQYRRGFLTPLCATLSNNMHATLVILGTSMTLSDADHVYTAISKTTNFSRITNFPSINEQDVVNLLKNAIDLSECEIPPAKRIKLTGRPRFSASVISKLSENENDTRKQEVLNSAIDSAIDQAKNDLKGMICNILTNDKTGNTARLLSRMVLAYKLCNGKISFANDTETDFVNNALCKLRKDSDGYHFIMDEPLVIEVVVEELKSRNIDPSFSEYLDQFNRIVENLGTNTTAKGNMLEPLIRRCLQRFNGYDLTDLPFLKGLKDLKELPTWCKGLKLQIDEVNTANGFGYKGNGHEADLEFFKVRPANKMLIEHSGTRQDGTWFFNKQYAGSIGIKFYSDPLKESTHKENETSTDIRSSFLKKDGTSNPTLKRIREDFEASRIPNELKGILRIHFEFPGVKGSKLETSVKSDPNSGVEDVMVYIDCSNMDEFFYDGISENQNDVHILKNIIRHVTAKSQEVTCNCQKSKCETERCSCVKEKKKCGSLCKYCETGNCNNLI